MKMKLLLYFLVALGPLLCEEKSSIGYRLRLRVPKTGKVFKTLEKVFLLNSFLRIHPICTESSGFSKFGAQLFYVYFIKNLQKLLSKSHENVHMRVAYSTRVVESRSFQRRNTKSYRCS